MKDFLLKKDIQISAKRYFIDAMGAMAYGLFATLLVGTILKTIGEELKVSFLTDIVWPVAKLGCGVGGRVRQRQKIRCFLGSAAYWF